MQEARFGRIAIARVVDLDSVRFPADAIFPDASREIMQAQQRRLGPSLIDPASLDLLISFHCFVLRTAQHIILMALHGISHLFGIGGPLPHLPPG